MTWERRRCIDTVGKTDAVLVHEGAQRGDGHCDAFHTVSQPVT